MRASVHNLSMSTLQHPDPILHRYLILLDKEAAHQRLVDFVQSFDHKPPLTTFLEPEEEGGKGGKELAIRLERDLEEHLREIRQWLVDEACAKMRGVEANHGQQQQQSAFAEPRNAESLRALMRLYECWSLTALPEDDPLWNGPTPWR